MRSRGTKRRPGAAEWASCLRVDSALTAWLQTVHSGCRVAQAPFGAAERGFCQAAQGCATWIINYKCFRKAHTCKGHRSQSQHFFFSFHGQRKGEFLVWCYLVVSGIWFCIVTRVHRKGTPKWPSWSYSCRISFQMPRHRCSTDGWNALNYEFMESQGSIPPSSILFDPIWCILMYYI